jgi:hypothetical protein
MYHRMDRNQPLVTRVEGMKYVLSRISGGFCSELQQLANDEIPLKLTLCLNMNCNPIIESTEYLNASC